MSPEQISCGTASCGHVGQIFPTGKCAHCYIADLERDCLTLAFRLYGEDDKTFAPETREVMSRWRPKCFDALKAPIDPNDRAK